jgi:hypothetical protein
MTGIEKPRAYHHLVWLLPQFHAIRPAMQRYMLIQNWQIKCMWWCSCFGALRLDSSQKKFNAGILAAECELRLLDSIDRPNRNRRREVRQA